MVPVSFFSISLYLSILLAAFWVDPLSADSPLQCEELDDSSDEFIEEVFEVPEDSDAVEESSKLLVSPQSRVSPIPSLSHLHHLTFKIDDFLLLILDYISYPREH